MRTKLTSPQPFYQRRRCAVLPLALVLSLLPMVGFYVAIIYPTLATAATSTQFTQHRIAGIGNDCTYSLAAGDVNGDGLLDIVSGNTLSLCNQELPVDNQDNLALNGLVGHKKGFFATEALHPIGNPSTSAFDIALADMNGDGAQDIIVVNGYVSDSGVAQGEQNYIYLNDGRGGFATSFNCNNELIICFGNPAELTSSVAVADFDGDGLLDLVTGNTQITIFPPSAVGNVTLYYNRNGNFNQDTEVIDSFSGNPLPVVFSLQVADFDNNSQLDVVAGFAAFNFLVNPPFIGRENKVYLQDNGFTATNFGTADITRGLAVGDLNEDGWPDIVVGNGFTFRTAGSTLQPAPNYIYLNDQTGHFPAGTQLGTAVEPSLAVAIGDVNQDTQPDIVVGNFNAANEVYENFGGGQFDDAHRTVFGSGADPTGDLLLADVTADGALDIVVGNIGQNLVYINNQLGNFASAAYTQAMTGTLLSPFDAVLADIDHDPATLEVILATLTETVILKQSGANQFVREILPGSPGRSGAIAAADVNGDGYIDLLVGGWEAPNQLYLNDHNNGFLAPFTFESESYKTNDIEIGDMDGDEDLDVLVNNFAQTNYIYLNDGSHDLNNPLATRQILGANTAATQDIALGDIDLDGDLDIAISNQDFDQPNLLYINDVSTPFPTAAVSCPISPTITNLLCFGSKTDLTASLNIDDVDGDGLPDVIAGNLGQQNKIYLNSNGRFDNQSEIRFFGTGADLAYRIIVHDLNNDGFKDLIVGNGAYVERPAIIHVAEQNQIFYNDGAGNFLPENSLTFDTAEGATFALVVGDIDHNGSPDIVTSNWQSTPAVFYNTQGFPSGLTNNPSFVALPTAHLPNISTSSGAAPQIINSETIAIPFRLYDAESDAVGYVRGLFSLDGGSTWQEAVSDSGPLINAAASPTGTDHVYTWNVLDSNFWGQSDNVVFRLEVYPQYPYSGTYSYENQHPSNLYTFQAATTFPFRLRGNQIRVLAAEGSGESAMPGALVYQRAPDKAEGTVISSPVTGRVYETNGQGYLQGRGALALNDELVALLPVSSTLNYIVYHTSAAPTENGLATIPATARGVQTLTVSSDNTLILFNLVVSIEWDARQDTQFLEQLENAIQRASQILYDSTNGQIALGEVHIYHDKGFWGDADVLIRASNQVRPAASLGGIVTEPISETLTPDSAIASEITNGSGQLVSTYLPGQLWMPPRWSPFGGNQGELGEDWSRTFAHELGHFLLFLTDNYIGVDDNLNFVLTSCERSLMDDPYLDVNSEFRFEDMQWDSDCGETFADQYLARADWETVLAHYPMLKAPTTPEQENQGPSALPLAVTQISFYGPPTPPLTLENHFFPLLNANGTAAYLVNGKSEAYLLKDAGDSDPENDYLIELGATIPANNYVEAWGAEPGDMLCVFDYGSNPTRLGCQEIGLFAEPLTLDNAAGWQPNIQIKGIATDTVAISVTNVTAANLRMQLITPVGRSSAIQTITPNPDGSFTAQLTAPDGAYYGHVRIISPNGTYQSFQSFTSAFEWQGKSVTWGGKSVTWGGKSVTWGGKSVTWGGKSVTWGGKSVTWGAPSASDDAQAVIFPLKSIFGEGIEFSLTKLNNVPELPVYLTSVGQGYRINATSGLVGSENDRSAIVINYLAGEVLGGVNNERFIQMYYLDEENPAKGWQLLETNLDERRNIASAEVRDNGIYLLAMAQDIGPLIKDELNPLIWPIRRTMPVEDGLSFITGKYSALYSYQSGGEWLVYDATLNNEFTPFINTLTELTFGSYWIWMTETVTTTFIPVEYPASAAALLADPMSSAPYPPMVLYGYLGSSLNVQEGDTLQAYVDGLLCGTGTVTTINGRLAYILEVTAERPAVLPPNGCGSTGKSVTLALGTQPIAGEVAWDVSTTHQFDLTLGVSKYYMPLIFKK